GCQYFGARVFAFCDQVPGPLGFMSLNHGPCEPSVSWLNFVLWISFSTSFSSGSSTKLAVSCNLHLLDQELSVTCPPSTASISTRKQPHLFTKHN
ncbi:hypothetical protein AMECASPLE_033233, partial [Ameca splendens]